MHHCCDGNGHLRSEDLSVDALDALGGLLETLSYCGCFVLLTLKFTNYILSSQNYYFERICVKVRMDGAL